MAIYHFSMQSIQRSAGRSATAAAAYRAGCKVIDERTGEIHDYTRKGGVLSARLILPDGGTDERAAFWSRVEVHHKHPRAVTAREIVLALPRELSAEQRRDLAEQYGRDLADRYGVAVDVCIHAPDASEGEENPHAHILMTACSCTPQGVLGKKVEALDPISSARAKRKENAVEAERPLWEALANAALERAGRAERIDHRTLEAQGIARAPTKHDGPARTAIKRRLRAAVDAATHAVESVQAELASAVRDAAQAVAVAAAAAIAVAAPSLALAEAPAPAQEARQGVSEPVQVVDDLPAPVRASTAPAVPVPDAVARQRAIRRQAAQLAELRKAELQARAVASAAAQAVGMLGDPRGDLVALRRDQAKFRSEREALEQQIQARGWLGRSKALLSDPETERVADLRRQAQDIGRQIAAATALVPQADRAAQEAQASAREARKAKLAVQAAQNALTAAQAEAEQLARQVAQRLRQDEPADPEPDPHASRQRG
jgi:hypothetical protein